MFDPEFYRSKNEVEEWKKRGPIVTFTRLLKDEKLLSDEDLNKIESEVAAEVEEGVAFAEAGTNEPVEDLMRFVYSERGA